MNDYSFYYPNRFQSKTPKFNAIINQLKLLENDFIFGPKQDNVIDRYFGKNSANEIKNSKTFSFLNYTTYKTEGANIFHFKKNILELLEKTDVSDIPIGQIKFPYNCFYISLRELGKVLTSNDDDDTVIDGAYVKLNIDSQNGKVHEYWIDISLCGYSENRKNIEFKRNEVDSIKLASSLIFKDINSTISDAINMLHHIMKETLENDTFEKETIEKEINFQLEEYKLLKDNINLIVNCILYISSENPDIEKRFVSGLPLHLNNKLENVHTQHKKKLVEKELKQNGYSKINLVGNSLRYSSNKSSNKKLASHWRRGHWRKQLHGKELKNTKLIWIKPTIVNKEKGTPTKGHIYTMD